VLKLQTESSLTVNIHNKMMWNLLFKIYSKLVLLLLEKTVDFLVNILKKTDDRFSF